MKPNLLVATVKSWNIERVPALAARFADRYTLHLVTRREELTPGAVDALRPRYVLFPHWSWKIPAAIFERHECVVFHMTDLPFGRGGSPLQNLLLRGARETRVCALRATAGTDEGPVYLRAPLDLTEGSAEEIYRRAAAVIFDELIPRLLAEEPVPAPQTGEPTLFRRRTPPESDLAAAMPATLEAARDFIRMLDAEGYPRAFVRLGRLTVEFDRVSRDGDRLEGRFTIHETKDEA